MFLIGDLEGKRNLYFFEKLLQYARANKLAICCYNFKLQMWRYLMRKARLHAAIKPNHTGVYATSVMINKLSRPASRLLEFNE